MKVGILSQWYEPEPASAAHATAIAHALVARGHEVKVLTGFPSYPIGRVYDGWKMSRRHLEVRDGISVLRVPDAPSHDDSAVRRAVSLTSFAASATAQVGWLRDVDVLLCYLTPATVGLAARVLRSTWGVPYVLYVQDLWPDTVITSGFIANRRLRSAVERPINYFLSGLYRHASSILAISPTMKATLDMRGARGKSDVVYNWIDEGSFYPAPPSSELPRDRTWVMYAGGFGYVQALDVALDAMALLVDRPDIGLAMVGDGVADGSLRAKARNLNLNSVTFLGPRQTSAMPGLLAEAEAQIVSLLDQPVFRGTVPSKVQACMAAGQPIICAVAGDAADLVSKAGAGVCVPPGDASMLANAIKSMVDASPTERDRFGRQARAFYDSELSARVGVERLENHLLSAVRGEADPR